jgi:hypothetical protein
LKRAEQVVPPALEALAPTTAAVIEAAAGKRLAKKEQKKAAKVCRCSFSIFIDQQSLISTHDMECSSQPVLRCGIQRHASSIMVL